MRSKFASKIISRGKAVIFYALPGGNRNYNGSGFNNAGNNGNWWSSLPNGSENAWNRNLNYNNAWFNRNNWNRTNGFSVRCLQGLALKTCQSLH